MHNTLGVNNWCSYCQECKEKSGEMVCTDKTGKFYGLPVGNVLCTPCMKPKKQEK